MHALAQRVTLVRTEAERLQDYLGTLSPAAWHHPSACTEWEVGDVVAHLARGAEAYLEWITRGLRGDTAPPASAVTAAPENATAGTARRAQRAIALRRSLGDQLLPTLQARTAQFYNFLVSLNAKDWEQRCYHPTGLQPVRRFVDLYITELGMHGWDIRSRLESVAHVSLESLPVFLEFMPDLIRWTFHPGLHWPAPRRYRFVLTDRSPHIYDIVIAGDQAWLVQNGTDPAHSTCQSDTETFVLLMFGRLPLPVALAQGRMRLEGTQESISTFTQCFRGSEGSIRGWCREPPSSYYEDHLCPILFSSNMRFLKSFQPCRPGNGTCQR
jgi:uncharacterized protein (TIGR03083 family)